VEKNIDELSSLELIVIDASDSNNVLIDDLSLFTNWVYINEKDDGIFHGMNKGLALAKGTLVWFLNSGDRLPSKVELESLTSAIGDQDWAVGNALKIFPNHRIVEKWKIPSVLSFKLYFGLNSFPHQSTIYNRNKICQLNCFQVKSCVADWELSLELIRTSVPIYINIVLSECLSGGYSERLPIRIKAFHQTKSRQRVYSFGTYRFCFELSTQFIVLALAKAKKGFDDLFRLTERNIRK
jgi:hypothetical protein